MKFYDRKYEMKELNRVWNLCKRSLHFTIISGRRRIGKTELVKQFAKDKKMIYFFVTRKNRQLILEEFSQLCQQKIKHFPTFVKFDEFLDFLINSVDEKTVIFFDEFQNFKYVDDSVFSDFQKIIDKNKEKHIHIIVAGSHSTLLNKVFSDKKEPLFGRATERYLLKSLTFGCVSQILNEMNVNDISEKIRWFSVFNGVPKYYVLAEEQDLKGKDIISALEVLLFREFSPLMDEVKTILTEEFGSEQPSFFSLLEAVALGKSKMTDISNKSGINIKSMGKYLGLLVNDFKYLSYVVPVTEKREWKSKKGRYFINDNFLKFWFRYVYRNKSEYESGRFENILNKVKEDFNSFLGHAFEDICREYLTEINKNNFLFSFQKIGTWWGHCRDENNNRREIEIDIVALNEKTKEILFGECKWKNEVNAEKIVKELAEKTKYVEWNNDKRTESYAVFAKSFSKKIKEFEGKKVFCFSLEDMEKIFK